MKCPYCAEEIEDTTIKCEFCGESLPAAVDSTGAGSAVTGLRTSMLPSRARGPRLPRTLIASTLVILALAAVVGLANYLVLQSKLNRAMRDANYTGPRLGAHFGGYVNLSELVFVVKSVPTSPREWPSIFKTFLAFAESVHLEQFQKDGLVVGGDAKSDVLRPQFLLQKEVARVVEEDTRNTGVEVLAYYAGLADSSVLVYDLQSVGSTNSRLDVFRTFLQVAAGLASKKFSTVQLAYQGQVKFAISGDYFQQLGREYSTQNPVYTIRTFPENLRRPTGEPAFGQWTGGWLGVLGEQMDDFNEFHDQWYLR